MKSKTMVLLVIAGVCGLVASYMTSRFLASQNEKVTVLVAKQKVAPWTPIKATGDQFEEVERPRNEVPRSAVTSLDSVQDHVVTRSLEKGEVLVTDYLKDKLTSGIEVNITPGKRAVGVRTTQEAVAGGFVLPGSHVDVIHTLRSNDKELRGRMILQNVHVLAIDQQEKRPEDKLGVVPATVTLEVFPEEAELLAAAQSAGVISFSLRSKGDDTKFEPPAPPTPVAEAPKEPKVEEPVQPKAEEKAPEPVGEKSTLTIHNGSRLIRATFITKDGETQTTIEQSQSDPTLGPAFAAPAPSAPAAPAAPAK